MRFLAKIVQFIEVWMALLMGAPVVFVAYLLYFYSDKTPSIYTPLYNYLFVATILPFGLLAIYFIIISVLRANLILRLNKKGEKVEGTISEIGQRSHFDGRTPFSRIYYNFSVEGKSYKGKTRFFHTPYAFEQFHEPFMVIYNPKNPKQNCWVLE